MKKLIRWVLIGAVTLTLGRCNARLYSAVPARTQYAHVERQFTYLKAALEDGAAARMQGLFPEGYFFSYVLYGLSWVNVGLQENLDPGVRDRALVEARWAYQKLGEPEAQAPFPAEQSPPHGVFYLGWRNYLLSGILLLQQPMPLEPAELQEYQQQCEAIVDALEASGPPFLQAYPGSTWPVDSFPALVSLRGHRKLVNERYEPVIAAWLRDVQALSLGDVKLLEHRTTPLVQGPRGTSQALILRFLPELDSAWAAESYAAFREQFVTHRLGLPGITEYPKGQGGKGDIDSGPLIAGVSLSATAVALGSSRLNGDESLHQALWQASELVGTPTYTPTYGHGGHGQKRYWFGLLPVTDAFLLWSQTATPWFSDLPEAADYSYPGWWRWPSHGLSLVLWLLLMEGCSDRRKARKQRRTALKQRRKLPPPSINAS